MILKLPSIWTGVKGMEPVKFKGGSGPSSAQELVRCYLLFRVGPHRKF